MADPRPAHRSPQPLPLAFFGTLKRLDHDRCAGRVDARIADQTLRTTRKKAAGRRTSMPHVASLRTPKSRTFLVTSLTTGLPG
jgi:hypothetical protein